MDKRVLNAARKQVGIYLQDVLNQRGLSRKDIVERSSLDDEQVNLVMEGSSTYSIDVFLQVISVLDCYFFLADREGEHLDFNHMRNKSNPDKSMDFKKEK